MFTSHGFHCWLKVIVENMKYAPENSAYMGEGHFYLDVAQWTGEREGGKVRHLSVHRGENMTVKCNIVKRLVNKDMASTRISLNAASVLSYHRAPAPSPVSPIFLLSLFNVSSKTCVCNVQVPLISKQTAPSRLGHEPLMMQADSHAVVGASLNLRKPTPPPLHGLACRVEPVR